MTDNTRGAFIMVISMAAFTLNDACMKALLSALPLYEVMLLRGIGTTLGLVAICIALGQMQWRMPGKDAIWITCRTLCEVVATLLFLTALTKMKLANLSAILQFLPLSVTLAVAIFFKEPVGWRRYLAIAIGFVGVMLIIKPGADAFNSYTVMGLAIVAVVTLRDISARQLSKAAPSSMVALYSSLAVTGFAATGATTVEWVAPTPHQWAVIALAVAFLVTGYIASIAAMRVGETSAVTPFRYTSLVVAIIVGFVFFNELPDMLSLIGASIVVASGLFTLYRERQVKMQHPMSKTEVFE